MADLPSSGIPSNSVPFLDPKGKVDRLWWLYLYTLGVTTIGNGSTSTPVEVTTNVLDVDADADTTDPILDASQIANLYKLLGDPEPGPSLQAVANALLLAQDGLLPDPSPRAQPVQVVTVGSSPFVYTAPFDGQVIVTGGTVSALALSRDGATFYAVPVGCVPMSRLDQLKVTYSAAPTLTFFPR